MKKISNKLRGVLIISSIIILIGLAGGLEQDMLTISQYIIYSVIALVTLAVTVRRAKGTNACNMRFVEPNKTSIYRRRTNNGNWQR